MPGGPNTTAGARTSASPTTPPSPVGSGHAPPWAQQLAKPADSHRAENPAGDPQRFAVEGAVGQHAPAPYRDGKDQHDGAEADDLHQQIGADRAGIAENVADRARGGVAEAGILHRPGHQRSRCHAGQRDQRKPGQFAQAPRQRLADRRRQVADQGKDAFDRWHAHGAFATNPEFRPAGATPRLLFHCPQPAPAGYSRRRDCCHRPAGAPDNFRGSRARRRPCRA